MMEAFSLYGTIGLKGLGEVNSKLGSLQKKLASTGKSMTNLGKTMSMKVTAPLLAMGVAAFKFAGDFDQAMRQTNVMLKASGEEFEIYKKQVLAISSATSKSADDVAAAFYQIVSAGYRGADAIDILNIAMMGAVGGAADAAQTTAALTKAMNIFQLQGVEGSTRAMDVFFGIVDSGLLSFEELASSFPRAATQAHAAGVSIEETGAALATLTKVSGSTDEAATELNAIFTALIKPSTDLQNLYKEWGVKNGPEAIKQFGGLQGVLKKVAEATSGNVDEIAALFPNVRAVAGVLPLATTNAKDFSDALTTVGSATGRTDEAFKEMAQGPGFQLKQLMTSLKNAAIVLGDALSKSLGPYLKKLIAWVQKTADWFGNLSPKMQKTIIVVLALVTAIGPLLMVLGTMITSISSLITVVNLHSIALAAQKVAMIGAAVAIKAVTVAQWLWNAAMTANPIGLVIAGIALLIAGIVLLVKNWDWVKDRTMAVWNGLVGFFAAIPQRIGQAFSTVKDIILSPFRLAIKGIEAAINWIISQINKIHITIPSWVPLLGGKGFGFNIPKVSLPSFAQGGIVTSPTLATIGERGPEAVIPLGTGTMGNVYVTVEGSVIAERDLASTIREELLKIKGRNNTLGL